MIHNGRKRAGCGIMTSKKEHAQVALRIYQHYNVLKGIKIEIHLSCKCLPLTLRE